MGRALLALRVLLLGTTLLATGAVAFRSGNVPLSCQSMYPIHPPFGPHRRNPPYSIVAAKLKSGKVAVTLTGEAEAFEGFMVQGRNKDNEVVGNFVDVENSGQILHCGPGKNAVTHNSSKDKYNVTMVWIPEQYRGVVTFKATVVKNYKVFWTGVASPPYKLI